MDRSFRRGLILLAGLALLGAALALHAILLETARGPWSWPSPVGCWPSPALVRPARRAGGTAAAAAGARSRCSRWAIVGVLIALAYLSVRFPLRFDLTERRTYSLSQPTVTMLKRLDAPVHIVFFHDPMMRETVELYELMARADAAGHRRVLRSRCSIPPRRGCSASSFAGTAVMESEGRKLQVNSGSETDIANGILRVSQSVHPAGVLPRRPRRAGSVQPGVARSPGGRARATRTASAPSTCCTSGTGWPRRATPSRP